MVASAAIGGGRHCGRSRLAPSGLPALRGLHDGLVALEVRVSDARQQNQNREQHQRENHDTFHRFSHPSVTP